MKTTAKAIRSKPMVGVHSAVGSLSMTAQSLEDAAFLTAIAEVMYYADDKSPKEIIALSKALTSAAKLKIRQLEKKHPNLVMRVHKAKGTP